MGLPLFFQKLLQDGFGIDPNEFLAKNAMEKIDVAGMDAEAVVDHREMTDAFGVEPVDRQHHVCGVHGMDEVSDDAVHLFPPVDLPLLIVCIYGERGIRCRHTYSFRFPDAMNDIKPVGVVHATGRFALARMRATFRSQTIIFPASMATSGMLSSNTFAR